MSLRDKTISGVKWTTVTKFTLAIIGLLKIAVLARYLEAEDFGLMALVTFILGFMSLFMNMGLPTAILHKQEISRREYASLYWLNFLFSLILCAIIFILSPVIAHFYEEAELRYLIPLASVSIIFSAIGQQFHTIKQKELEFRFIAFTEITAAVISLIVGIYCAVEAYGVLALIYAALVQYATSNLVYFINGLRSYGLLLHFNYKETGPFLKIGIYQVGGQIINYFNRDIDILLIGKFFGSEVLGAYSLAKQLVRKPISIINPIITSVASPVLSLLQENEKQLRAKFLSFLNIVSTANFTAYLLMAIFAYPLVLVFYGADYLYIVIIAQILCIYMFLRSIGNPISSLIIATGRTDVEFYWNLLVLFIMPIAVYVGAQFTIEVVAFVLSFTMIGLSILAWKFMIHPLCGASFREYFAALMPDWRNLYHLFKQEIVLRKQKKQ